MSRGRLLFCVVHKKAFNFINEMPSRVGNLGSPTPPPNGNLGLRYSRTLSYDGNPSPDHLYGVLRRHTDPPAVRLNHRTPTFVPHSGVLPNEVITKQQRRKEFRM